jgi:hypothetical protein
MAKSTPISISKGLHGFISYQNWEAIRNELSLPALSLTNWAACGMFSVHHALVFIGQGESIQTMKSLHPRSWDLFRNGLDLDQLRSIIRNAGAKSDFIESNRLRSIKFWLDRHLSAGHPVIIGDEAMPHWCCLGGRTSGGAYITADSAENPAIAAYTWDALAEWMETVPEGKEKLEFPFQALAVLPGRGIPASRSIVPWIDGIWKTWACDSKYAKEWSNLLKDMLRVFRDAEYVKHGIPAGEFLDEHAPAVVLAVSSLTGWSKQRVEEHANGYRDAANFHNLVVDPGQESATIARFTLMLQARVGQN